jgi:hypothetical protein
MEIYQLTDFETNEELGLISIISQYQNSVDEVNEGWVDFNQLEETELDITDIDDFVLWFNENYVTQIERVYINYL